MRVDLDLVELNEWLLGFLNFEKQPNWELLKLATMEKLCDKFGHPEKFCPCFHVAGSKGKGTISANIAGILRAAGYKTGVYASPHVLHYTERVGTGAEPFAQEIYDAAFCELKKGVEEILASGELAKDDVSWFELSTTFAMLCFREAGVDYAVYEVGLGGRLDATNVILPECVAFGPIEIEHTEFLGETLAEIAHEKAGILKTKVPAVSVAQDAEVEEVLRREAREKSAEIEFCEPDDYVAEDKEVAWRVVHKVLPEINRDVAQQGMEKVRLLGRYERIEGVKGFPNIPYVLVDVAHTSHSMEHVLARMKSDGVRGKLLFGCLQGKNVKGMVRLIAKSGIFTEIYLTQPGDFRKSDLAEIEKAFRNEGLEVVVDGDYDKFIPEVLAMADAEKVPLIVLGSVYLAGEVKKRL